MFAPEYWTLTSDKLAPYTLIFVGLQTVFAFANILTLIVLIVQLGLSRRQTVKDDIVSAGRHSDEIYGSLVGSTRSGPVIETVYADEINAIKDYLSKHQGQNGRFDLEEYWYVRRIFAHVARMKNLTEQGVLGPKPVKAYYQRWVEELCNRMRESIILRALAFQAVESQNGNWSLSFRDDVWANLTKLNQDDYMKGGHIRPSLRGPGTHQ